MYNKNTLRLHRSNNFSIDGYFSNEKFVLDITKAQKDLSILRTKVESEEYQVCDTLWSGADISIDDKAPQKNNDFWPNQNEYIITPYSKELSWVFIQLKNIFYTAPLIIFETKFQFFFRLATVADSYINSTKDGVGNKKTLLMITIDEAEVILKEMLYSVPHYKS
jgi:hypothetical protein|tara:strand:- start:92 stop:586 length:495 start_codon:yes stop_codon:yes gene_type:complete